MIKFLRILPIPLLCTLLLVLSWACRKDFDFATATGQLRFSKDTVFLDTVFTNIGSSTYTLKVYNLQNEDVFIPSIRLANGTDSRYRLNVDGVPGKTFEEVPLLARDSLFIFVETTIDITQVGGSEFLYTDAIVFEGSEQTQEVPLVTLVKDAHFLYPQVVSDGSTESLLLGLDENGDEIRLEGFLLTEDELEFTAEKPYVIYGYAGVPEGRTLRMAPGTRVHFHNASGILVEAGASLQINGMLSTDSVALENEVIFEGDHLETVLENVAGQWGTVWITPGSVGNTINHLTIKNATIGLLVDGDPTQSDQVLQFDNSQILNSATTNLWGRTAHVESTNSIFGSSGDISLYCNLGGHYGFKHCTIANYWTSGFRNAPALAIDNTVSLPGGPTFQEDLIAADFSNCIIAGNRNVELGLLSNTTNLFEYTFLNCSFRFNDTNGSFSEDPLYDFTNLSRFINPLLNPELDFTVPNDNEFALGANSEGIDQGDPATALEVPIDLLGIDRTSTPDIGALERQNGN